MISLSTGSVRSKFFRLCVRAPRTTRSVASAAAHETVSVSGIDPNNPVAASSRSRTLRQFFRRWSKRSILAQRHWPGNDAMHGRDEVAPPRLVKGLARHNELTAGGD